MRADARRRALSWDYNDRVVIDVGVRHATAFVRLGAVLLAATALGISSCHAATSPATSLSITVYPHGIGATGAKHYALRCSPTGGNVPSPARACAVLASLSHPFAQTPPNTICSDISLGPEEAIVKGTLRGFRVAAHLRVRDSCEINRWRRVRDVVPGFPGR